MADRNRPWGVHTIRDMIGSPQTTTQLSRGHDVRAVPLPYDGTLRERIVCAWWVFSGKAYAVRWPEPGEFERASRHT